jgi:aromatic-L-amino-acid decarboxylase
LLDPVLSICVFRYAPERPVSDASIDEANRDILRALARESRFVVSSTVVKGHFALRPCFINPRTTLADVDEFVDAVIDFGERSERS